MDSNRHIPDEEVLQSDHIPPLVSETTCGDLVGEKAQLHNGVSNIFNGPSKMQENTLHVMLAEPCQNLIVQSQARSGKTFFSLAELNHVNPADKWCQCIIIVPTTERAVQTVEEMKGFDLEVKQATFGTFGTLKRGAPVQQQIVIGTPGTVRDWCWKRKVMDPQKIRVFVVDEADVMMSTQGHQDNCIRIHKMLPDDCQRLLFSASMDHTVRAFAQRMIPNPHVIRLNREDEILNHIKQL